MIERRLRWTLPKGRTIKPILTVCSQLGMNLCWRSSIFKMRAGTSAKSREEAVEERIRYLD